MSRKQEAKVISAFSKLFRLELISSCEARVASENLRSSTTFGAIRFELCAEMLAGDADDIFQTVVFALNKNGGTITFLCRMETVE